MADEKTLKLANTVYETICSMLTKKDWSFTRHEEDMVITCGARGHDLPMDLIIAVNPNAQVVSIYSQMPYSVGEDKRVEAALAIHLANYGLLNGGFDYDIGNGNIRFRIVTSFRGSILSEELFEYMILVAAKTIDDYNDKFLMISNGMMSVQQFAEWDHNRRNG